MIGRVLARVLLFVAGAVWIAACGGGGGGVVGNLPPQITAQPAGVSVAEPASASFSVTALGTPPFTHQWQRSDDGGATFNDITGATLGTYTTGATSVGADHGDRYRVLVGNLEGTSISASATLTVTAPSIGATPKVATATQHSIALTRNGTVHSWGLNTLNELGRNPGLAFDGQAAPIPALTNVIDIATTGSTSLALRADGSVRSWGSNGRGLLGIGTTAVTPGVQTVSGLNAVTRIAMGYSHALALRSDGTVWAWGANVSGALGDGTKVDRTVPVQVAGLSNVIEIAGGGSNSFALRADGTVWAWGEANSTNPLLLGQGGSGDDQLTPIQVQVATGMVALQASETNAFARTAGGQMWAWGQGVPGVFDPATSTLLPQLLVNLPIAAAYATGTCFVPNQVNPLSHLLIAQASGALSAFGDAGAPTAGFNALAGVTDVSAVSCHAIALRSDGTVWATGLNNAGQLGDGSIVNRTVPVQVLGLNLN